MLALAIRGASFSARRIRRKHRKRIATLSLGLRNLNDYLSTDITELEQITRKIILKRSSLAVREKQL